MMEVVKDQNQEGQNKNKESYTFMEKEKVEDFKKKAEVVKKISVRSAMAQLRDKQTITWAAGIGLMQGLKYGGSISRGIKAGVATMLVIVGTNVVSDLLKDSDEIKKA